MIRRVDSRYPEGVSHPELKARVISNEPPKYYKYQETNLLPSQAELERIKAERLDHYNQFSAHQDDYISRSRSNSPDEIFNTWN